MGQSAREFFDGLEAKASAADTSGIDATYRFDVDGAGTWTVVVGDDGAKVTEGAEGEADCTISTSEQTFEALLAGTQSPTTAFMLGKVKITGDMGAAMKLQKLFSAR